MIVAGNWKMNLSINEAIELSNELLKHNEIFSEEKIIIFPSFINELISLNSFLCKSPDTINKIRSAKYHSLVN